MRSTNRFSRRVMMFRPENKKILEEVVLWLDLTRLYLFARLRYEPALTHSTFRYPRPSHPSALCAAGRHTRINAAGHFLRAFTVSAARSVRRTNAISPPTPYPGDLRLRNILYPSPEHSAFLASGRVKAHHDHTQSRDRIIPQPVITI